MDIINKIFEILVQAKNIIITTHINPDGDAIGSVVALNEFAKLKDKNTNIIINDEVPYNYRFLEGWESVFKYEPEKHNLLIENADAIFILDVNDIKRVKSLEIPILKSKAIKIVIDHHLEPKEFADYYFVDSEASSTSELIWKLLIQDDNFECNEKIASSLYTAIMTDSGSFRYPRTDAEVHRIIADLIDFGADPVKIYNEVYNRNPINIIRLLGIGYSNLESYFDGQLCLMTLRKTDFLKTETDSNDVEGFVEELHSINGVKVGILMTEILDKDEIRVSFRSKGNISVREIAQELNGGGHFHAAGARVSGANFNLLKESVVQKIGKLLMI